MSNRNFNEIINPFENSSKDFKNLIGYESITTTANTTKKFIKQLREGELTFIKTGIEPLDECIDGGIMPNSIFVLGGLSGSGKSALEDNIVSGILESNPRKKIIAIHFNYEMLTKSRMLRKVTASMGIKKQQIINKDSIPDQEMDEVVGEIEKYKEYPIHYINNAINHKVFYDVWVQCKNSVTTDYTIVMSIDHIGLSEKLDKYENGLKMLENFAKVFNSIKKEGELSENPDVIIIPLTQLNREIESDTRLNNPSGHAPRSTDLRGGDDLRNISDYVSILHKPGKMDYRQEEYTKQQLPIDGFLYLHGVKYREGSEFVIQFEDELEYSRFTKGNIMFKGSTPKTNFQIEPSNTPPSLIEPPTNEDITSNILTNTQGSLADDEKFDLPF